MVSLSVLLIVGVPLFFVALAIKFTSAGEAFYRQRRIGRMGKPFLLYKFRTMVKGNSGAQVTALNDARITRLGRLLRRWKIDEIPQLLNVLRGEMSIIGPRPEVEKFVQFYTPTERRLLEQTPGLAGMSQLVYPQESVLLESCSDPEEVYIKQIMPRKIAIDLEYEERRNFFTDLQVLLEVLLLCLGKSHRTDWTLGNHLSKEGHIYGAGPRSDSDNLS